MFSITSYFCVEHTFCLVCSCNSSCRVSLLVASPALIFLRTCTLFLKDGLIELRILGYVFPRLTH